MTLCKDGRLGRRMRARIKELGTKHIRFFEVMMSEALVNITVTLVSVTQRRTISELK